MTERVPLAQEIPVCILAEKNRGGLFALIQKVNLNEGSMQAVEVRMCSRIRRSVDRLRCVASFSI